jgi:hypothetical protein
LRIPGSREDSWVRKRISRLQRRLEQLNYKVEERTPYLGETSAGIGDATWKRLDRATMEMLVGEKV